MAQLKAISQLTGGGLCQLGVTDLVQSKISDFQKIEAWSVDDHNACHESDLAWLLKEIHSVL